ncbi:hypothetical protein ACXR2W_12555 [Leucobacter sp. HY1908]
MTNTEPTDLSPAPAEVLDNTSAERLARKRRQLRTLAWGAAATIVAIGIAFGGVAISNGVADAKAERVEVVSAYDEAFLQYRASKETWSVTEAEALDARSGLKAADLAADDEAGKAFLAEWDTALSAMQQDADAILGAKQLPTSATNAELQAGTKSITQLTQSLDEDLDSLLAAQNSLESSIEERAEIERKAKAEAELQAKKAAAQPVTYEDLFRAGDQAAGNYYTFTGKIIQAIGDSQYRVSITADPGYSRTFWKDPILVMMNGEPSQRLLEDDIISFTAASLGVTSYESIFKQTIQIPLVAVAAADVSVTGRDG